MAISEKAEELLELYPPFFRNDRHLRGILDAHSFEINRLEAAILDLMGSPKSATYLLEAWERLVGVSSPDGSTVAARRTNTLAYFRQLQTANAGRVWEARVSSILRTTWLYATPSNEDVLGLWWDLVPRVADWNGTAFLEEANTLRLENSGGTYRRHFSLENTDLTVKFVKRSSGSFAIVGKHANDDNRIIATVTDDQLSVTTVVDGTNTERDAQAVSVDLGAVYYLRFRQAGNDLATMLYTEDPSKLNISPLAVSEHTLTGDDAIALSGAVRGQVGFAWSGSYSILDTKGAIANVDVPDRTIRIYLPHQTEEDLNRAKTAIRAITPATIQLEYQQGDGFILGLSRLGEQGFDDPIPS